MTQPNDNNNPDRKINSEDFIRHSASCVQQHVVPEALTMYHPSARTVSPRSSSRRTPPSRRRASPLIQRTRCAFGPTGSTTSTFHRCPTRYTMRPDPPPPPVSKPPVPESQSTTEQTANNESNSHTQHTTTPANSRSRSCGRALFWGLQMHDHKTHHAVLCWAIHAVDYWSSQEPQDVVHCVIVVPSVTSP